MRRLTVVLDHDDVACLQALHPESLAGEAHELLAFDLDVHIELRSRGVPHITPWDLVDHRDRGELEAHQSEIWKFWQRGARVMDGDVDLLKLAEYRHAACFQRLAWAAFVLQRALEKLRPREVTTFEETSGHGLDQPAGAAKMPLLFALLRGMAERSGVRVRLLRRGDAPGGGGGFVDRVATQVAPRLPLVSVRDEVGERRWVLFYGSGGDLLRQLPIIEFLQQDPAARDLLIVQIYKTADEAALSTVAAAGQLLWHESQVTSDTPVVESLPQAAMARMAFDQARREVSEPLRGVLANPYLDIHFDFIFGEYARRMAWHARAWPALFGESRPQLVVVNHPAAIFDLAGHAGISALMLPHALMVHGVADWYHGSKESFAAAIGRPHAQRLAAAGFPAERVRVTGEPAIDPLLERIRHSDRSTSATLKATLLRRMGRSVDDPLILLPTTSISSPATAAMLPVADWAHAAREFDRLAAMIARRPQWAFVVKCHPRYDHRAMYEAASARLPEACRMLIVEDEPLEELVPAADVVVFPNAMSSALVEASLWPRPVIILDTSLVWWDHREWETDHWPRVDSVDELEMELERLVGDPGAYADGVSRTHRAASAFFGSSPKPAAAPCAAWISEVAAEHDANAGASHMTRSLLAGRHS